MGMCKCCWIGGGVLLKTSVSLSEQNSSVCYLRCSCFSLPCSVFQEHGIYLEHCLITEASHCCLSVPHSGLSRRGAGYTKLFCTHSGAMKSQGYGIITKVQGLMSVTCAAAQFNALRKGHKKGAFLALTISRYSENIASSGVGCRL